MKYIKRYLSWVPPLLVVWTGFVLSGKPTDLWVLTAIAFAFIAWHCYESYFDRKNNVKRSFGYNNGKTYLILSTFAWVMVLFIAFLSYPVSKSHSLLLTLLPILSVLYSFNRTKLYVPNHILAFQWAVLPLFGVNFWHIETLWPFVLSLAVFFIISARSLLEDTEHKLDYKKEYKQTLFSTGMEEEEILRRSARLILFGLLAGSSFFYFIGFNSLRFFFLAGFLSALGGFVALFRFSDKSVPFQKNALDVCSLLMLASIIMHRYW